MTEEQVEYRAGMSCVDCHHVDTNICRMCDDMHLFFPKGRVVAQCTEKPEADLVNHPAHYTAHPREVIDIIKDQLLAEYGLDGFRAYCWGNEIKYRMRAGLKGDAGQDIEKAMKYKEFREAL